MGWAETVDGRKRRAVGGLVISVGGLEEVGRAAALDSWGAEEGGEIVASLQAVMGGEVVAGWPVLEDRVGGGAAVLVGRAGTGVGGWTAEGEVKIGREEEEEWC